MDCHIKEFSIRMNKMIKGNKVIAAVRTRDELVHSAASDVKIVFHISPDILTLEEDIKILHNAGKLLFLHMDLADGIGRDRSGIEYIKKLGVDGIISTRTSIIKYARDLGVLTVQRFFIVDSQSIYTTIETLKSSKAQMIEVMPGLCKTIKKLKEAVDVPIIAGGLIETEQEALELLKNGAFAVSTGKEQLWRVKYE